jgi:hypothetical protein
LQTLSLAGCQGITDASVSALKKLTSLCDLDLSYTNITDAAVAALSPFIPKFNASGNYHVTPQEVSKIRSGLSTTNCGRMVLRHVNGEPRTSISEDSERYVGMVLYRTQEIFQGYGNRTYVKEDFPDQAFTRENDYIDDGRPHSEYPVKPY